MKSLIAGLATSGETYLPSGLLWGWRALTPVAPFTEAASSPDNTTSIMIFMTDGFNTLSQDDEYHDGHQREDGFVVAQDICKNINDDKIDVYTVAYNLPNVDEADDTRRLLKQCASDLSKNFEARDAAMTIFGSALKNAAPPARLKLSVLDFPAKRYRLRRT